MATHSSIFAWRILWTLACKILRQPGGLLSMGSSIFAWRILWTLAWKILRQPGGLPSMGSLRVGHD